jgi:RNA recognition motif-containing protein
MFNLFKDNFFSQTTTQIKKTSTDIEDDENDDEEEQRPIRTKLYVTNFPQNCTRRQLTEFFSKFGNVLECAIMWDTYAFIHYASRKEASFALKKASARTFMGNKLFIQLSTSRHRQESNWYQKEVEKLQTQLFSIQKTIDCLR